MSIIGRVLNKSESVNYTKDQVKRNLLALISESRAENFIYNLTRFLNNQPEFVRDHYLTQGDEHLKDCIEEALDDADFN